MPSLLKKIFQPKWQSNNPATRLEAIKSLQWEQTEQREILLKLAGTDPDLPVRRAALTKITDPDQLLKLWGGAGELQEDIIRQVGATLGQVDAQRLAQFAAHLADDPLRLQLFNALTQTDAKATVLGLIQTPRTLADIAIQANASRLRQVAAEQLQDVGLLEEVLKAAQSKDKGVYQIVKAKLTAHRDAEKRRQQAREEAAALCAALEAHATSEATHLYAAKYETLRQQWQALADNTDQDLAERADRALKTCAERAHQLQEADQRQQQEAQQRQTLQHERLATCELLEATVQSLQAATTPDRSTLPGLDALVKTQENRWLEATHDHSVTPAEQKRYQGAMQPLRQYLAGLRKFTHQESRLQELLNADPAEADQRAQARELQDVLGDIHWPDDFPLPPLLQEVQARLEQARDQLRQHQDDLRSLRQRVQQVSEALDAALSERSLKQSAKLYKDLQAAVQQLAPADQHDHQAKLKLFHARLQELRDWQGFATQPKQLDLCARMEHLAEQHLDPQVKAHRIKELQDEWRALGGSSDQNLWQRFKTAADEAYKPCQAFFAEQDLLKQANLEQRERICEQLEAFLEQIDWTRVDWKALEKIDRTAREEWHRFFPVDPKRNKLVQKRFQKLIDELESHLNQERERNAARKADIVRRAQALTEQADLRVATQGAKALQKEWQAVGMTSHRDDRQLWKEFRAACDQIFAKLDAQRSQHEEEVQQRTAQANQILAELDRLGSAALQDLEAELPRLREAVQGLGALPREQAQPVQDKLQKLEQQIRQARKQQRKEQELALWQTLAVQAESLAAYEDSLIAGSATGTVPELQLPEKVPASIRNSLEERQQRLAQASDYPAQEEPARLLAVQAEIAAGLESPSSDQALRMNYQMQRLSAGLGGGQAQLRPLEEITDILARWYGLAAVAPATRSEVQSRIDRALSSILDKHEA